jgi:hypothetical protein
MAFARTASQVVFTVGVTGAAVAAAAWYKQQNGPEKRRRIEKRGVCYRGVVGLARSGAGGKQIGTGVNAKRELFQSSAVYDKYST